MIKRTLLAAGFGLAVLVGAAGGQAGAQTDPRCYPVVTADCPAGATISDTTAVPGQSLTVTATGLDPGTSASAVAQSTPISLGTKTVAANGSVSFTFTVPADFEPGAHSVTITGTKAGAPTTLTVNFTVVGQAAAGSDLVRTGSDSSVPMTQIGIALLAAGGAAVYVAKRKRPVASAA